MELILDTNFVIAAEREGKRGTHGPALQFLAKHAEDRFLITFTVVGELACGRSASPRAHWDQLCRPFAVLAWNREVSWQYGEMYRKLREQGQLIGANDLWIAATALAYEKSLVTKNTAEFSRVAGLELLEF